jgi:hypothetical protein
LQAAAVAALALMAREAAQVDLVAVQQVPELRHLETQALHLLAAVVVDQVSMTSIKLVLQPQ